MYRVVVSEIIGVSDGEEKRFTYGETVTDKNINRTVKVNGVDVKYTIEQYIASGFIVKENAKKGMSASEASKKITDEKLALKKDNEKTDK